MTAPNVILFLLQLGMSLDKSTYPLAELYFYRMIKDGRVIGFYKDGDLHGVLAFSLCTDFTPYWEKTTWTYRPHQADGTTLYVEFLASVDWDKEIRQKFQEEVLKLHPQIEQAVWHKWADWGDRKVTWRRQWAMK